MMETLQSLVPSDKHDLAVVERLKNADRATVVTILDQLLDWTADGNWPVARPLASFLVSLGDELVPNVRRVLTGHDATQIYFCLLDIVSELPEAAILQLESELRKLAEGCAADDPEGNYEIAAEILEKLNR